MFRRPLLALALGLLVAGAAAAAPAPRSQNLLADPGFETTLADHPWMPAGWDTSWSQLPTVFFGRDTTMAHEGRHAVSVANVSTLLPLWHNWSQTLVVGREVWNKDLVFTAWTRSNGVQGRAYILLQAYRDTVGKMARVWNVPRDTALKRLGILMANDPYVYLASRREAFSEPETEWVRRQVRVYIPASTNLVVVRCGLFGTGQVFFDETSLTVEDPLPAPELPVGVNLLQDPGFEGNTNSWDLSLPPYDEMRCEKDTTEAHSGRASMRCEGGMMGMVKTRAGVAQLIANRSVAGKHLRLTGWIKCDSLMTQAYLKLYCTTADRVADLATPRQLAGNTPWTKVEIEVDAPEDTHQVWAWMVFNGPSEGRVYFDDASLEILGPARTGAARGTPARPAKPAPGRKPGAGSGGTR